MPAPRQPADPLLAQAQQSAAARFGPQEQTLSQLLQEAQADLLQGAGVHSATALAIRQAATEARPQMESAYASAMQDQDEARRELEDDLDRVEGSNSFSAAAAREAAAATGRLAAAGAGAQHELISRGVSAEAGRAYGIQQLLGKYQADVSRIGQARRDLESQRGAFLTEAHSKLTAEQKKADFEARQQAWRERMDVAGLGLEQGRLDVSRGQLGVARERLAQGPAAGGPRNLAPSANASITASINRVWSFLKPRSPKARGQLLSQIQQGQTSLDLGAGQRLSLPKVADPTFARAAYEMLATGRMSSATYHQLRQRGYVPPRQWMPRRSAPRPRGGGVAGQVGGVGGTVRGAT